ncbi:MAG: hypothetical protein K1X83_05335 [Oligoflexia bacterium]|nr:hypothetical protein [Oligoflexia bacterium]
MISVEKRVLLAVNGLPPSRVLLELQHAARDSDGHCHDPYSVGSRDITTEEAATRVGQLDLDGYQGVVNGRLLCVDLRPDESGQIDLTDYCRLNGPQSGMAVIRAVRTLLGVEEGAALLQPLVED